MNVGGEFTVDAPRDGVFRVLRDAHSFVRFVDGVQDLEQNDLNRYLGAGDCDRDRKFEVHVDDSGRETATARALGDPHMDLPPVLMALHATATVTGPTGQRKVAVEDLFASSYETTVAKNELIAEVRVPAQGAQEGAYMKVTTGSADDWPALGVAAVIASEGNSIESASLVASAATEKGTRLKTAEAMLSGRNATDDLFRQAGDAAIADVVFVADVRGSAPYKRELLRVFVRRALSATLDDRGAA
jgi:carbon-monoxide dehydrogenase medium subunit